MASSSLLSTQLHWQSRNLSWKTILDFQIIIESFSEEGNLKAHTVTGKIGGDLQKNFRWFLKNDHSPLQKVLPSTSL